MGSGESRGFFFLLMALSPTAGDEFRPSPCLCSTLPGPYPAGTSSSSGQTQKRSMMNRPNCDCLVCRLEKSLIAEFAEETVSDEARLLAASSNILSCFPSPLDLVRELHAPDDRNDTSSADSLLREILERNLRTALRSICQRLLLLVFVPTIHRTASQITAAFPSLARDDVSQHVVSVFLEFLDSPELQTRGSHVAFTIARKVRRKAFRWAIHESRGTSCEEVDGDSTACIEESVAEEPSYAEILLQRFLDNCQRAGWLSLEERNFLLQSKIEGVTCQELASRNGHSAVAVQHRIHRLLGKLRRLAQRTRWERAPEQLELFPRG
jgi:DNA-directed RNA polymerase specialized sigma24 family protein